MSPGGGASIGIGKRAGSSGKEGPKPAPTGKGGAERLAELALLLSHCVGRLTGATSGDVTLSCDGAREVSELSVPATTPTTPSGVLAWQ